MSELKFHWEAEYDRARIPQPDNIYSGFFKSTTQTTAVYEGYCLIDSEDEIMKIYLNGAEAAFSSKDGNIALLRKGILDIYANKELEKSIPVVKSSNIRDYLPDFSRDLERVSDTADLFLVGDKEMTVMEDTINFDGKEYRNEIHEPGCRYFVAWSDKLAVLGNNKSFNFMYFYDGLPAEVEEYSTVSLRTDESSFESIPVVDMKFWKNRLLLIDESKIIVFTVDIMKPEESENKPVVSYYVSNGKLIQMSEEDNIKGEEEDSNIKSIKEDKDNSIKSIKEDKDNSISNTTPEKPSNLYKEVLDTSSASTDTYKNTISELGKSGTEDLGKAIGFSDSNKSTPFEFKSFTGSIGNHNSVKIPTNVFDLQKSKSNESLNSSSKINTSDLRTTNDLRTAADLRTTNDLRTAAQNQRNIISDVVASTHSEEIFTEESTEDTEKKELEKLDSDFVKRFEALKTSFKKLDSKKPNSRILHVLPSHFNLDGLYNLIFHNHTKEYESAISNMIFQIENLKTITECNVLESIKYIDSKIFSRKMFRVPIRYHDPLCIKFQRVMKITNPAADLLDGIKVLNIQNQKMPSSSKPDVEAASIKETPKVSSITPAPLSAIESSVPPKAVVSKFSNDLPPKAQLNQVIPPLSHQAAHPVSQSLQSQPNTQPSSQPMPNLGSISLPFGANISGIPPQNINKGALPALFNSQTTNNSLFVKDTSSLFDSIAANTLNVHNPQAQQTPEQPAQSGDKPVSAFNRLASSRNLFK